VVTSLALTLLLSQHQSCTVLTPPVLPVQPLQYRTYVASVYGITPPTPVYVSYFLILSGNATKTIRVMKIWLSGTQTTAGNRHFGLELLTSVTGGSPTAITPTPYDSFAAAATATVNAYESGTTPSGATGSFIRTWDLFLPAPATASAPSYLSEHLGDDSTTPIILHANQYLAFTLIGGAITGPLIDATIEWTESP
jgi:hypothetical protein